MSNCSVIMSHDVAFCLPEASVEQVAILMKERNVGCIPVVDKVDDPHPIGVVTDRDLVIRVLAARKDPRTTQVQEVMTKNVLTCSADASIDEALALMERRKIRRVLTVNGADQLVGILSEADIATKMNEPVKTAELARAIAKSSK